MRHSILQCSLAALVWRTTLTLLRRQTRISLLSSWAGLLLFLIELLLVDRYIRSGQFWKDSFWIRGLVLTLLFLDTLGAIISCVSAWKVRLCPVTPHLLKLTHILCSCSLSMQVRSMSRGLSMFMLTCFISSSSCPLHVDRTCCGSYNSNYLNA